jgi:hypothetical protein
MRDLEAVTKKGIGFLAKEQLTDGSFMCLVSTTLDDYRKAEAVPAIVPVNIALSSLVHLEENAMIKKIKDRAADFLEGEKNAYWSFNYWFRKSDWYTKEPYPDDLDDTFCALAALYEYRPEIFNGEAMAKIVTMLTSAEKGEGGPYDMWLVPPSGRDVWDDTDLVVNSNIAFFLALQDISLPNLNAFIEKSIDEEDYDFPYNKMYPGIYFISRFYKGAKTAQMVDTLLATQESDGKWENPLRTALAISALINFSGGTNEKALLKGITYLRKTQAKDGSWKPFSFYFQMKLPKKTLYAGASTITTALCIEAIHKFTSCTTSNKATVPKPKKEKSGNEDEVYQQVVKMVKRRFAECDDDLKRVAKSIIAKTLRGDDDKQIALLPYFFRQSFEAGGKSVTDDFVVSLGAANVFGWMAYTIYDDFLDEEGSPRELAVANICLRESVEIFRSVLPHETGFADFSKSIFDCIDNANAWEVEHCRNAEKIPDYGNYSRLAERSLGHALTPVAILFALGYKKDSAPVKGVMQFFTNYIIARQLNDDAHDWEDDLSRGQINAAGAKVLHLARGDHNEERRKKIFWEKVVVTMCKDMTKHVARARQALLRMPMITDATFFERLLRKIEKSSDEALEERDTTMKFIRAYKGR